MTEILTDLSIPTLSQAIKWNLYDFFRYLGRAKQTELLSTAGLLRWRTRIAHPWFSGVLSTQPVASSDGQAVEDTLTYFESRGVPIFTWWLAPTLATADWEPLLSAHGFRLDASTPGMAADLGQLNDVLATPPNLEIAAVSDAAGMRSWTRVFVQGYGLPAAWEHDFLELMTDLGWEWPLRNYIATLDGEPVAASSVFLSAGVAGIYCVATLPEARGRGIGAAVTLAPLRDARELGYRVGILQSSDMGFSVYQRLGFREVCRMEHFYREIGEG